MKKEKIDRINELAHKKKSEGLTPDEVLEQAELRREFLAELSRHGQNINQIAAKLNSGESLDRVGIKIIADDNDVLHKVYEALGK